MSFDWDKFRESARKAAEQSGKDTDKALASRISCVSRLTCEEITELFPQQADAAKLAELLAIVKSSTAHNQKVADLQANIVEYADVIVRLVARIA